MTIDTFTNYKNNEIFDEQYWEYNDTRCKNLQTELFCTLFVRKYLLSDADNEG